MYARINETEIFFDTEGSSLRKVNGGLYEVPTIVVLHGILGLDHRYLREGLGQLSEFAQVLFVDLRGQGRSAYAPVETVRYEQMADDIAALIGALGIRKPYVFGHSLGGLVALHLVLRHHGLARGAILAAATPTAAPMQNEVTQTAPSLTTRASPAAMEAAAKLFAGELNTASIAAYFEKIGPLLAAPNNASLAERLIRGTTPNIELMRYLLTHLPSQFDISSRLNQVNVPVLLLAGAHDWVNPPRTSLAMAKRIPRNRYVEFENSGHLLFSEEPANFRSVVEDFLASDAAPGWY